MEKASVITAGRRVTHLQIVGFFIQNNFPGKVPMLSMNMTNNGAILKLDTLARSMLFLPVLPPGLAKNRFEALQEEESEKDVEIGVMSYDLGLSSGQSASVNQVTTKYSGRYVSAGKGKITVDSGAGESVMPKDLLLGEELVEGQQKKMA